MELLWARPEGLTARQLVDGLAGPEPAITTVLTVLERLRVKGRVQRSEPQPPRSGALRFTAAVSESEHVVRTMVGSLMSSTDRPAALLQFAGALDGEDREALRQALAQRQRRRASSADR